MRNITILCLLISLPLFLTGCPSKKKRADQGKAQTPPKSSKVKAQKAQKKPSFRLNFEDYLKESWLESIAKNFDLLKNAVAPGTETRREALALLQNRYGHFLNTPLTRPQKLTPPQKILRMRIHLRLAQFYRQLYRYALLLNDTTFSERFRRKGKLQLGNLFYLFWGRTQFLLKNKNKAEEYLRKFLKESKDKDYKKWAELLIALNSADEKALRRKFLRSKISPALASEVVLGVLSGAIPEKLLSPSVLKRAAGEERGLLYVRGLEPLKVKKAISAGVLKGIIAREKVREGKIETELEYYDPGVLLAQSSFHARYALALAGGLPGAYPLFYRAVALEILGQKSDSAKLLEEFLHAGGEGSTSEGGAKGKGGEKKSGGGETGGRGISGEEFLYYLFSGRLSPRLLKAEARSKYLAMKGDWPELRKELENSSGLEKLQVAYFILAEGGGKELPQELVEECRELLTGTAERVRELEKVILKRYSPDDESQRGKKAIINLRLYTYGVRQLIVWSARSAMSSGKVELSIRLWEQIHQKAEPYKIGRSNEPLQIAETMWAYTMGGQLGVSTLFAAKNKESYPSFYQLWSLFRLLRIFKGMSFAQGPKGG